MSEPVLWPGWYMETLATLRELCPPMLPVRTRRVPRPVNGGCGGARLVRPRRGAPYFALWIYDPFLDEEVHVKGRPARALIAEHALESLRHEWSHLLAWTNGEHPSLDDHGPEFGLAYSRVYCATVEA